MRQLVIFYTTLIKISEITKDILNQDDIVKAVASRGLLNLSAYARSIKPEIEKRLLKKVKVGSIVAALSRYIDKLEPQRFTKNNIIEQLSVHASLEGISFERTSALSKKIGKVYNNFQNKNNKAYITLTQGISEITLIAESDIAKIFYEKLKNLPSIYHKKNLVGITVGFDIDFMTIPNLFYSLIKRLAIKNINIIEIISTASELTFVLEKHNLQIALDQLQKSLQS